MDTVEVILAAGITVRKHIGVHYHAYTMAMKMKPKQDWHPPKIFYLCLCVRVVY